MLAPLVQSKQNNRKFWLKRKATRRSGGFFHVYTQGGEALGVDFYAIIGKLSVAVFTSVEGGRCSVFQRRNPLAQTE